MAAKGTLKYRKVNRTPQAGKVAHTSPSTNLAIAMAPKITETSKRKAKNKQEKDKRKTKK